MCAGENRASPPSSQSELPARSGVPTVSAFLFTVRKCHQRLPKPSVRPPSPWAALRVIFLISFRMKTIEMAAAVLRGAE